MAQEPPRLSKEDRAEMKQWLDNWARVGPLLEELRWNDLLVMTPADFQRATRQVWELWQPDWPTDEGEGLLRVQRVLKRLRHAK